MEWQKVLDESISLKVLTKMLPQKGNLVYEYNPFRNYRVMQNMYEYRDSLYSLYDLYIIYGILLDMSSYEEGKRLFVYEGASGTHYYKALLENPDPEGEYYKEVDQDKIVEELEYCYGGTHNASRDSFEEAIVDCFYQSWIGVGTGETDPILHEKGELVDFITDELQFSLSNPVSLVPQYSYDGSVNLVLNDGFNIPRLINSRFSATGRNTYEIVDRKGDNDTNIYDQGEQFDIDTSLYKRVTKIPKLSFQGVIAGGSLPVGNYHFYFKFSDADGNETDFVAESGLVSVFIGYSSPSSVHTGVSDENSAKSVRFYMTNIDASYNYVTVYYSRASAQADQSANVQYCKVDKKFTVNNAQQCSILITGYETMLDVTSSDINLQYNVASAVGTAVECQNMLMMGNIHKPDIPYEELADLSLRFLPYVKEVTYNVDMTQEYAISSSSRGYFDPSFIYSSVGYWGGEYYRLGVVYIMPNNELTPVFNIRGRCGVYPFGDNDAITSIDPDSVFSDNDVNDGQYNHYNLYKQNENTDVLERVKISINESSFYVLDPEEGNSNPEYDEGEKAIDRNYYENAKGVVSFHPIHDTDTIYALDIRVDDDVLQELKKYVKGWFFVRQKRIPTILCQGITIGLDNNAYVPTIPTQGGFLIDLADSLDESTYVEVDDINDVNYISEGFLTRYSFELKRSASGYWAIFGKVVAAVAIVCAVAAASIVTFGGAAAGMVAGLVIAETAAIAANAAAMAAISVAMVVGATAVVGAVVGAAVEGVRAIERATEVKKLDGRNTDIPSGYKRSELDSSRLLGGDFRDRVIIQDPKYNTVSAVLCPDYEVDQPFYNQIFTGNEHVVRTAISQSTNRLQGYSSDFFSNDERHFYIPSYYDTESQTEYTCKIQGVPDDIPLVGIDKNKYRSRAGWAEEAWQFEQIGREWEDDEKKINAEIVRGSYGPYVAISGYPKNPCDTINIMIPGYTDGTQEDYMNIRMDDDSSYFAISERMAAEDMDDYLNQPLSQIVGYEDRSCGYRWELYRGDCYICQVTHRLNRNFNDPSAPYNDTIVDEKCWKKNYDPGDADKYQDINLGDVNAVQLGMWLTFRIRSSYNLNIRSIDESYTDEKLMCGHGRGYYPYLPMDVEGCYKTPESAVYNDGFKKSVSERYNFALPDVPYIKNWFGTRIMYSDIHINDAYKNGFRVFKGTNFIDCPRTYGEIVKLVEFKGKLLVVFEHGIGIITVTTANIQKNISAGHDYINAYNVLSEPTILSDAYGSQWQDSIMKTPENFGDGACYVYGVDTVAKKIWRTDGASVQCLSDMRVQQFLNENITLSERELTPIIGIRNVKTCYNAFKRDVLFTFYDNLSGFEEKVWNLCWNELLQSFITFYSWVPSYMENINNMPFSFNRNTSKWIAKLGVSHADNSFADGITLTNNIIENSWTSETVGTDETGFYADIMASSGETEKKLLKPETGWIVDSDYADTYQNGLIGILGLTGVNMPTGDDIIYKVDYSIERDNFLNYRYFNIKKIGHYYNEHDSGGTEKPSISSVEIPVYGLYLNEGVTVPDTLASELYYRNIEGNNYADWESNKRMPVRTVTDESTEVSFTEVLEKNYPIYKNRAGKRLTLDYDDMINNTHIVRLLNIKAKIYGYYAGMDQSVSEYFYNYARDNSSSDDENEATQTIRVGTTEGQWVDCGYYESVVAVIPRWNMQFLSTDFWKHGQAGLIDIADKIYPAYWYGEQHPFEFEFVVVDSPATHKIFTNLEIVSNNVKPESFHYEIVGDVYDFHKDKVNMYFRQEAMKALYQWNGADILYNSNFLETQPDQQKKSADLPHKYYARDDTFNEIYDSYKQFTSPNKDYDHLTGSEIVYYPTRQEYRVWTHQKAVSMDDFEGDSTSKRTYNGSYVYDGDAYESGHALIESNCLYQEDKWKVVINPIVVCYRNEFDLEHNPGDLSKDNSTWTSPNRPPLPVCNSPLPPDSSGNEIFPNGEIDPEDIPDCLTKIGYSIEDLDPVDWLDNVDIHGYQWGGDGTACNREEVEIRDKFVKVRIRYTGDQLAVIDFINTIYQLSYA